MDDGFRALAVAVIRRAYEDSQPGRPEAVRMAALGFLTDETRLELWCALAELDPTRVIEKGRRLSCRELAA